MTESVESAESMLPTIEVGAVFVTEKLRRDRAKDDARRAKRRGTWVLGIWGAMTATIGGGYWLQGSVYGHDIAALILIGAAFTGLYGVYYAVHAGFFLAMMGKSRYGEFSWLDVLWATLWATIVGGGTATVISWYLVPNRWPAIIGCSAAGFVIGATVGNVLAHRRHAQA
ncbi:MAG: hypothetical protein QM775_36775 [Pirellulales bacterium]